MTTNGLPAPPQRAHPGVAHLVQMFDHDHLPPHLQEVAEPMQEMAQYFAGTLLPGPELSAGLRKLLEAKDCFVRQAVADQRNKQTKES